MAEQFASAFAVLTVPGTAGRLGADVANGGAERNGQRGSRLESNVLSCFRNTSDGGARSGRAVEAGAARRPAQAMTGGRARELAAVAWAVPPANPRTEPAQQISRARKTTGVAKITVERVLLRRAVEHLPQRDHLQIRDIEVTFGEMPLFTPKSVNAPLSVLYAHHLSLYPPASVHRGALANSSTEGNRAPAEDQVDASQIWQKTRSGVLAGFLALRHGGGFPANVRNQE
ncbi:MAG: hypothetical protein JST91_03915 [Actinobacteria bacterium]|nr:hypothetical protein [Actinomycetota bacterium]